MFLNTPLLPEPLIQREASETRQHGFRCQREIFLIHTAAGELATDRRPGWGAQKHTTLPASARSKKDFLLATKQLWSLICKEQVLKFNQTAALNFLLNPQCTEEGQVLTPQKKTRSQRTQLLLTEYRWVRQPVVFKFFKATLTLFLTRNNISNNQPEIEKLISDKLACSLLTQYSL